MGYQIGCECVASTELVNPATLELAAWTPDHEYKMNVGRFGHGCIGLGCFA